ncbi:hypothetical protein NW130_05005 [Staphylococcus pettenkoferi]|uniref:hypothetical protein n=1 Tax=Staphylococcus pettenkoferi TaxID=170573 RepID=UPI002274A08A|nr:hypothetical protein [Staphylococcus pettenkoferi]MCY1615473.1 hypothetical protein [Staphylococcus pettenkoferi]
MQTNDMQQRKRKQMNGVPCHYQGTERIGRKNQDVEDVEKIGVYQRRLSEVLENE